MTTQTHDVDDTNTWYISTPIMTQVNGKFRQQQYHCMYVNPKKYYSRKFVSKYPQGHVVDNAEYMTECDRINSACLQVNGIPEGYTNNVSLLMTTKTIEHLLESPVEDTEELGELLETSYSPDPFMNIALHILSAIQKDEQQDHTK